MSKSGNRVLRPRDLDYEDATLALRSLQDREAIVRIAHGYYLLPPDIHRATRQWRPPVEALALGIAVADYGRDEVALMGVSAARLRGTLPRAVAVGIVAIPKSFRPRLWTPYGEVHFVSREVGRLDLEKAQTDVVNGWATTPEQTLLDIARRPTLGGISQSTAGEVMKTLARQVDWDLVQQLAQQQRGAAALRRALKGEAIAALHGPL